MLSPLRYPGSKADLVPVVAKIFTECGFAGLPLVEPYAGSATVAIGLVDAGICPSALIGEQDPLLYSFWRAVFERTEELIERFNKIQVSLKTWHKMQPLLKVKDPHKESDIVELGVAGLFFNRANFSGILNGGPIGGLQQLSEYKINCRTNKTELAKRIRLIACLKDKIKVHFGDALELLKSRTRRTAQVLYIDPPYYVQGENLYRYYYGLKDHKRLAEVLAKLKANWLLSYDDHHVIEFLYEEFHIRKHDLKYSAKNPRKQQELLISNFKLPHSLTGWKVVKPKATR